MSPEECQLLTGLLDRIKGSANVPRDPEAEALIADAVRVMPYAPYLLAQAVIVQNQALGAANERLTDLQTKLQALEQQAPQPQTSGSGGFLSNLGSMFGVGAPQQPAAQQPPAQPHEPSAAWGHEQPQAPSGPWGQSPQQQAPSGPWGQSSQSRAPAGPWGQGPQAQAPYPPQPPYPQQPAYPPQAPGAWGGAATAGGGFLHGALGAAAGVAGGVLLADSIRGLFAGHAGGMGVGGLGGGGPGGGGLGIGSGLGGVGGLGGSVLGGSAVGGLEAAHPAGETVINNYYDDGGSDKVGVAGQNDVNQTDPSQADLSQADLSQAEVGQDVQPDGMQDAGYDDSDSADFGGGGDDGTFDV